MPSKALLRPGEALDEASRVPGVAITGHVDLAAALARRDAFTSNWDDAGQAQWVESVGVDLIRGHGRLAGERTVDVTASDGTVTRYTANKAVVIATGTGSATPPIPGLSDITTWDNRDITAATAAPRRLLIIGGGVIGVEMAQAWKSLGSEEVTVLEMFDRLLAREEDFVGDELARAFEKMGIVVHTGAEHQPGRTRRHRWTGSGPRDTRRRIRGDHRGRRDPGGHRSPPQHRRHRSGHGGPGAGPLRRSR
jgi:pyruvate/2-oxoglutarate dehydrogenase complex dihydrolipoamide dehydrogenase (E3) component